MQTIHQKYADSLRNVADWIETHPEIPLPSLDRIDYFPSGSKDIPKYLEAFGSCNKAADDTYLMLRKHLGLIRLEASWRRTAVGEYRYPEQFAEVLR